MNESIFQYQALAEPIQTIASPTYDPTTIILRDQRFPYFPTRQIIREQYVEPFPMLDLIMSQWHGEQVPVFLSKPRLQSVLFSILTPENITLDKWFQEQEQLLFRKKSVLDYTFVHSFYPPLSESAIETITVDKWFSSIKQPLKQPYSNVFSPVIIEPLLVFVYYVSYQNMLGGE